MLLLVMSADILDPEVRFAGEKLLDGVELDLMHCRAHEECFIAYSVTSEVRCEPVHDAL